MLTNFGLKNFQYSGRQNILITPDQNISKGAKCFSTPRPKYVPRRGGECFNSPLLYTTSAAPILRSNTKRSCHNCSQLQKHSGKYLLLDGQFYQTKMKYLENLMKLNILLVSQNIYAQLATNLKSMMKSRCRYIRFYR